jgi:hypothetical protein
MKEVFGELWDYYGRKGFVVCITTNATPKKNGEAVMGRGCAAEAKRRIPAIALELGRKSWKGYYNGFLDDDRVYAFQVKNNFWEKADLDLILNSVTTLHAIAVLFKNLTFVLPRPGCGNGKLRWEEVEPLVRRLPDNVWIIDKKRSH